MAQDWSCTYTVEQNPMTLNPSLTQRPLGHYTKKIIFFLSEGVRPGDLYPHDRHRIPLHYLIVVVMHLIKRHYTVHNLAKGCLPVRTIFHHRTP